MKTSLNKVYTVEFVRGFSTADIELAIIRATRVARETGSNVNIYADGVNCSYVKPSGQVVERVIKTQTVVNKYHHLLKYNTRDFKRLSF